MAAVMKIALMLMALMMIIMLETIMGAENEDKYDAYKIDLDGGRRYPLPQGRLGDYSITLLPVGRTLHYLGNVFTPSRLMCFFLLEIKVEYNTNPAAVAAQVRREMSDLTSRIQELRL
jgi:hypothetical protein